MMAGFFIVASGTSGGKLCGGAIPFIQVIIPLDLAVVQVELPLGLGGLGSVFFVCLSLFGWQIYRCIT